MHDTTIPENKTSHTPGPWQCRSLAGSQFRGDASTYEIGSLGADMSASDVVGNARLIAAAPDLLDALYGIIELGRKDTHNEKYDGYYAAAKAAIAKATGIALLLLLVFAPTAHAQSRPFKAALGTYLIAASADLSTTEYQLGHGAREVLLGAGASPTTLGVTKIALASVLASETHWLASHRHPKVACWILILGSGLESAAAIHNARVNR